MLDWVSPAAMQVLSNLGQSESVIIAIAALMAFAVMLMHFRAQHRRHEDHHLEQRKAAQYLSPDVDLVSDSRPYTRRARWAIIMSTISIIALMSIGIFSD